jgi:hypothetical protein
MFARTKAQGWLLWFWVGGVCPMGVLYGLLWALYNPKPPKCALTCQADLAADTPTAQQLRGMPHFHEIQITHTLLFPDSAQRHALCIHYPLEGTKYQISKYRFVVIVF